MSNVDLFCYCCAALQVYLIVGQFLSRWIMSYGAIVEGPYEDVLPVFLWPLFVLAILILHCVVLFDRYAKKIKS